jgi:hypothetical protein
MDITFDCDKCGQSIVIDEAGVGLTVQCPACGTEFTVTKPVPPPLPLSVTPSSQELYYECRDLAYELRVEDAIRVLKEAEKARALERDYQLSETFSFHGSAQGVIELAKWAIGQSLQELTPKEEHEILGAIVCAQLGWRVCRAEDELLVVTLGSNLSWPTLNDWFWRFKEAKYWPSAWEVYPIGRNEPVAEFYEKNLRQLPDPMLVTMHGLSLNARRVLLDGWLGWTRAERTRLKSSDYDKAINELASAGFARRGKDLPIAVRLSLLPISNVREIQKKHGVKGARSKEQIVKNLLALVAEETLVAELSSDTYVKLDVGYRQLGRFWFEYSRAKLLTDAFDRMLNSYGRYRQFQDNQSDNSLRTKLRINSGSKCVEDDCLFCATAVRKFERLQHITLNDLPPFHPGCTCWTMEEL